MTKQQLEFKLFHLSIWKTEESDKHVKAQITALMAVYYQRLTSLLDIYPISSPESAKPH